MTLQSAPASNTLASEFSLNGPGELAFVRYIRWAAIVTAFLYTAGYATVGFGLLFFGALWRLLARRSLPWQRSSLDLPLAAFGVILLVSAAASPYRSLALNQPPLGVTLMLIVSGVVYFGSFAWLLRHGPGSRGLLLRAWAIGAVPAVLVGLIDSIVTHGRAQIPRGVGPNGLGTTLLLGSILGLGLAFRARGWERWFWLACGVISLVGLVGTESRASLVGWIVGAAYLVWRELRSRPHRMAAMLAGGAVLLVVAVALTPSLMKRVRDTAFDVSHNRVLIWQTSLAMIGAHPLLGTGFGTFEQAYGRVKASDMSPEPFAFNLALNIATETGILGFLGALWVAVAAVRVWRRAPGGRAEKIRLPTAQSLRKLAPRDADLLRPIISALWIGLLVDQFADNTLFSISTSAAVWLLLAFVVASPEPSRGDFGAG